MLESVTGTIPVLYDSWSLNLPINPSWDPKVSAGSVAVTSTQGGSEGALDLLLIFLLDAVVVIGPDIDLLSTLVRTSVEIFLTLIMVDWRVLILPVDSNTLDTSEVTFPSIWLLILLVVSLNTFLPVSNFGVVISLGLGIKNEPITLPRTSLLSLRFEIVAWALDVSPTNLRFFSAYPKYVLSAFSARVSKSMLRITDVEEYNSGILTRSAAEDATLAVVVDEDGTTLSTITAPKVLPVPPE